MMKTLFHPTLLPLITLCMAMTTRPAAGDTTGAKYQPQLDPVFTAGETFTYRATVEYRDLLRVTDSTKKKQKDANGDTRLVPENKVRDSTQSHYWAELIADAALARTIFKNGSLQDAEFLVRHCELIDDKGNTMQLLRAGTIIGARKQADGQVAFAIDGKAPNAELAARLSVLITLGDEHTRASDLIGAPGPVAVGTTWAVNEKAMLKSDLPRIFPGVDRVAGSMTLRSAQPNGTGAGQTTVTGTYRLGDVHPPFPADVEANSSDVRFEIVVTAPITPGPGKYDVQSSVLIHHTGHTGNIQIGLTETDIEAGFTIDQEAQYVVGGTVASAAGLATAPLVPELPPLAPGMSSAPVLRPKGSLFHPLQQGVEADTTAPTPANSSPTIRQAAPPPLQVPADSPFSKAQDLPTAPANSK